MPAFSARRSSLQRFPSLRVGRLLSTYPPYRRGRRGAAPFVLPNLRHERFGSHITPRSTGVLTACAPPWSVEHTRLDQVSYSPVRALYRVVVLRIVIFPSRWRLLAGVLGDLAQRLHERTLHNVTPSCSSPSPSACRLGDAAGQGYTAARRPSSTACTVRSCISARDLLLFHSVSVAHQL